MLTETRTRLANLQKAIEENERLYGGLLISIPILVFVLVSLIPIMFAVWMSFQQGITIADMQFVGLGNFQQLLGDPTFKTSVENGLIYALYAVAIQTILGVAIALTINESFRFKNLVRTLVLTPYLVPTVAVVLMFDWILSNTYGIVNYYLKSFGITEESIQFFGADLAMHTVVWVSSWRFTVFITLIVLARLQSIDSELYEMAKINGANAINRFFDVTLPHIKSTLYLLILLRTIWMFNKFDMIWLMTQGGPFRETLTMVIFAFQKLRSLQFGVGAAISVIMFAMLVLTGIVYFTKFNPEEEVEIQ